MASTREALEALRDSMRLRHTASHALNEASSRSHCIFSLQVHRKREVYRLQQVAKGEWRYVAQPSKCTLVATRANLVDLAGSEDARETYAEAGTTPTQGLYYANPVVVARVTCSDRRRAGACVPCATG